MMQGQAVQPWKHSLALYLSWVKYFNLWNSVNKYSVKTKARGLSPARIWELLFWSNKAQKYVFSFKIFMPQGIPVHFELNTCLSALLACAFLASFKAEFLCKTFLWDPKHFTKHTKDNSSNNKVKYCHRAENCIIPLSKYNIPTHN